MIYTTRILDSVQEYENDVMFDLEAEHVSYVISYDELDKSIIIKEADTYLSNGDEFGVIDSKTNYSVIDIIKDVSIKEYVQTLTYLFNNSYAYKHEYSVLNKIVFDDDPTIIS